MFEYRIQPGDTLDLIATNFGLTTDSLLAANPGIQSTNIAPAQIIMVPISAYLYARFPWYITFPYLFISQPWHFWNNRLYWPAGPWRHPHGRPPHGGFTPRLDSTGTSR
ncbi:MAG: LysM peptidoglycan-binding domain-containing protein [Candidatus Fimivivens sp.]